MRTRESFDELKARLLLIDVIAYYIPPEKLELSEGKTQIRVQCPRCESDGHSLSINPKVGKFKCFRCETIEHGPFQGSDPITFVEGMEDVSRPVAAKVLSDRYPPANVKIKNVASSADRKKENTPFRELKNVDFDHELVSTVPLNHPEEFGIGFYSGKGMLRDSLVMPLYRGNHDLIAYCKLENDDSGRLVESYLDLEFPRFSGHRGYAATAAG